MYSSIKKKSLLWNLLSITNHTVRIVATCFSIRFSQYSNLNLYNSTSLAWNKNSKKCQLSFHQSSIPLYLFYTEHLGGFDLCMFVLDFFVFFATFLFKVLFLQHLSLCMIINRICWIFFIPCYIVKTGHCRQ